MLFKGATAKDKQDTLVPTYDPNTLRLRQEGCHEFKATVAYGVG